MASLPKRAPVDEALRILGEHFVALGASEAAIVRNPSYIYSPIEVYPLAPAPSGPLPRLAGVVKDMDGTTTTTEPLCLHSLAWMVRQVTGRIDPARWPGLDRDRDYPHIIGNSTTKHVEYLLTAYQEAFRADACLRAYVVAAIWTLAKSRDEGRRREVLANIPALGLHALLAEEAFRRAAADAHFDPEAPESLELAALLAGPLLERFRVGDLTSRVRAAVDIYYMRYHVILADVAAGRGERRAREVLGSREGRLIEPMPGVGPFLAAVKGWLGEDLALFHDELAAHVLARRPDLRESDLALLKPRLAALGRYFAAHPIPVAVVTSSIAYEANIVLGEVFCLLRRQVESWPVAPAKIAAIRPRFETAARCYDAIVTASDSSEIRLKPHRDLYSIALHAIGLKPADFPFVIGFEDSESGVVAIRAAGVGLSVAVPFADTAGHDLSAAAHVLRGQLPEAMLLHSCFLDPKVLEELR